MKKLLTVLAVFSLLTTFSCKDAAQTEALAAPDYAAYDKKVEVIRSFYKAHMAEDMPAITAMIADTLKFSPSEYNANKWLGKDEFLAGLKAYQDNYENINYAEGLVLADSTVSAYFSGSVFPQGSSTNNPNVIRSYGTWTATHSQTQQVMGVKFYSLCSVNDEGKIVMYSSYFDTHSLIPKDAAQ